MSDLISRQDVLMEARPEYLNPSQQGHESYNQGWNDAISEYYTVLKMLPSVETPIVSEKHQLSEETPTNTPTDLISRQDALAEFIDDRDVFDIMESIESLPSADRPTGWIPVSERLPDDDGRYLVTYPLLRRDDLWVATAWYGTPPMPNRPVKGKCFFVSDDEWGDVPYDDVVAWMPLPEPYKGGEE